jgi:hypothetical protein
VAAEKDINEITRTGIKQLRLFLDDSVLEELNRIPAEHIKKFALTNRILIRLNGTIVDPGKLKKATILEPPGAFLERVADFFCSKKTFHSIVEPQIADMQHEYFEAFSKGRTKKAAWIRIRESIRFFYVLGVHRALKSIAGLFSHPKMPQ